MRILTKNNTLRAEVLPNDGSRWRKELMTEEYVSLKFQRKQLISLQNGDYITFEGKNYYVVKASRPKWNTSKGCWEYEQKFYAEWEKWKYRKFFFDRQNGNFEKSWSLTQFISYFLNLFVDNLEEAGLGNDWTWEVHDNNLLTTVKNITFDGVYLFDGITAIARTWDTEWWVVNHTLHIGKCEFGTAVPFQIGGLISDMSASESDGKYATRLYAFGSTRNLPKNYRGEVSGSVVEGAVEKRLMLPEGTDYVDAWENLADEDVVEDIAIFDDIYPRRVGTMSNVTTKPYTDTIEDEGGETTEVTWNAYRFRDAGITFKTDYMIDGEELRIVFQTGLLAGCDFAVAFNPDGVAEETSADAQLFEIIRNEDYGTALPNDTLKPQNGDTYILYGFDTSFVGETYVPLAEQELLAAAQARVAEMVKDDNTYTCTTDPVRCAGNYIGESGGLIYDSTKAVNLDIGQKVTLVNAAYFGENNRESRVRAFEKDVNNLYKCTYDCGKSTKYSVFSNANESVNTVTYNGKTYVSESVIGVGGGSGSGDVTKLLKNYLSKVLDDVAEGFITFVKGIRSKAVSFFEKGIHFGEYTPGALGTGGAILIDQAGNSTAEFDYITIRKAATFRELTIKELRHVGGEIVLSAAAMKCSKVVPLDPNMQPIAEDSPMVACYKCSFYTDDADGNQQVFQEFVQGDLARCQTFGSSVGESSGYTSTRYYWRKVLAVGEDYIILGNGSGDKDVDCTSAPAVGDNIVQLGYVGNDKPFRQSAIILSATDTDAPSMKSYQGINDFTLPQPVKDEGYDPSTGVFHCNIGGDFFAGDANGHISYDSVNHQFEVKGKVQMTANSTVGNININNALETLTRDVADAAGAASDAQDAADAAQTAANNANTAINNLSTGNENLVVNGGFTGLYQSESVNDNTTVNADTQIFSDPWGRWDVHTGCTIVTSTASATGVACQMSSGTLTQNIARGIISSQPYTLSLLALSSDTLNVSIGGWSGTITLTNSRRCSVKFVALSTSATLTISGSATISEIQLIQGSVTINDWTPSPEDNNKFLSYYKNFAYLMAAIEQADTSILGGLVLTQQIRVGNYADHVMTQETGGMNGDRETDDSPFLWGGGSMTQAMETISAYANDPTYQPTQAELQSLAKFVVTHGGRAILNDIIMRGIVYATGGKFTGQDGLFRIDVDANNRKISVFGPSAVRGVDDFTPVDGATEVEYLTIGEFMITGGSGQSWKLCPTIKFHYPTQVGGIDVVLDPFNGLVFSSTVNGVTTRSIFTANGISLPYSTIFLENLPTNSADCSVGQVYRDGNTLKIKTS